MDEWQRYVVTNKEDMFGNHRFFPTFQEVVRRFCIPEKEEVTIRRGKYLYKFHFDWIDEDICGIEVFRRREGEKDSVHRKQKTS